MGETKFPDAMQIDLYVSLNSKNKGTNLFLKGTTWDDVILLREFPLQYSQVFLNKIQINYCRRQKTILRAKCIKYF